MIRPIFASCIVYISLFLSAFIGAVAAALNVQIIGNKEIIRKDALCKTIIRLLK